MVDPQAEDTFSVLGNDIGHLNSAWQTEIMGVPRYDEVDFMNEYQIYCAGRAQPGLVSQFAHRSGEAFDWFIDNFSDDEKAGIVCLNWPAVEGYDYKTAASSSPTWARANFGGQRRPDARLVDPHPGHRPRRTGATVPLRDRPL